MSSTPDRLKVLVIDYAWPSIAVEEAIFAAAGIDVTTAPPEADDEAIASLAAEVDGILVNWKAIPDAALEAARRCRVVSRYGVGIDNIPVALATRLGIVVTNVPGFCTDEVADHTLALLLAAARRVVPFAGDVRAGRWSLDRAPGLPRLSEQTLGLVGYGRIARAVARRALGFGLDVQAYTPSLAAGAADRSGDVRVARALDELLGSSDYVSLHLPVGHATRHLIDERALRLMRPGAYLVNTSRGGLVDQAALARALDEGWIAGAALDVLADEPPSPTEPLLTLENALITPHAAFSSDSAIAELQTTAARNVVAVLEGREPESVVNGEVLTAPQRRRAVGAPARPRMP